MPDSKAAAPAKTDKAEKAEKATAEKAAGKDAEKAAGKDSEKAAGKDAEKAADKDRKVKPEKPNDEEFQEKLSALQKEHGEMMEKLNAVKAKLDGRKPNSSNPQATSLKQELQKIRDEQSSKKNSKTQLQDKQKVLNDSIGAKVAAHKTARAKVPYKSAEELDAQIGRLEKQVDSGTLKLVEERKALADISQLRKQRKLFAEFDEAQAAIDKDRAAMADLRKQMDDPEARALSDRYTEIKQELDTLKTEQDAVFENINALRDERTKWQNAQQEKFQEIKAHRDAYYSQKQAFRDYEHEAYKARHERKKAERDAYEKEKKRKVAERILDEASEKAYTNEIIVCEGLINYFDPENASKKTEAPVRELAAQPARVVSEIPKGTKLVKKDDREEDYFIGGGKSKKGKKNRGAVASTTEDNTPSPSTSSSKFTVSIGILEELARVNVTPPMSKDDIPQTLEKLKEKVKHYKDNQDRVTKENIAKAKAEVDRLDAADKKEEAKLEDRMNNTSLEEKAEEKAEA